MKKKPTHSQNPTTNKIPTARENVEKHNSERLVWRVSIIDKDGKWGWGRIDSNMLWDKIHSKLKSFESMTLHEITNKGSHNIKVNQIVKDAQKRLEEIKQADVDELFSLRLSGKERIWGIVDRNIFKILWWDPKHEICLSSKKHT